MRNGTASERAPNEQGQDRRCRMSERVRKGASAMAQRLRRWLVAERGQSMVEYAIVTALIAIVAMGAVQALGGGVSHVFNNIVNAISGI